MDPDAASAHILHTFEDKWHCKNAERFQRILELPASFPGLDFESMEITFDDIDIAFRCMKRLSRVDAHGVSRAALYMVFQQQPDSFIVWFRRYITSIFNLRRSTCLARAYGKESTSTRASDVRMIIPLSSALDVADALLQRKINDVIDEFFEPMREQSVRECARPYTQLLEITHSTVFAVEKILDNKSVGTVAQMDVQKHFDSVDLLAVFRWLLAAGFTPEWAVVAIWIQLLPRITFKVLNVECALTSRSTGSLTGSRVASAMARVPILDLIYSNVKQLLPHALSIGSWCALCATYVDNIVFLLSSIESVPVVSSICESYLSQKWGQTIKPSSKQALLFKGTCAPQARDWEFCSSMRVLGIMVSVSGSTASDYAKVTRALWSSFWANAGATAARALSVDRKLLLLKSATEVHLNGHVQSWLWIVTRAKDLDSIQKKMLKIILHRKLGSQSRCTDLHEQCVQRARTVKQVQHQQGRWSTLWVRRAHKWRQHCLRHTDNAWTGGVHLALDQEELEIRRALSLTNRPFTRNASGWIFKRLSESYADLEHEYEMRKSE